MSVLEKVDRVRLSNSVQVNSALAGKALHELAKYDPQAVRRLLKEADNYLDRIKKEQRGVPRCLRRF